MERKSGKGASAKYPGCEKSYSLSLRDDCMDAEHQAQAFQAMHGAIAEKAGMWGYASGRAAFYGIPSPRPSNLQGEGVDRSNSGFILHQKEYTGSLEFDGYKEFLGQQLYYSHKRKEELFSDLVQLGYVIEDRNYRDIGNEVFLWVTARKPEP